MEVIWAKNKDNGLVLFGVSEDDEKINILEYASLFTYTSIKLWNLKS